VADARKESTGSEHVAAFFRTDDFLRGRVAAFAAEGLAAGEQVILLATHEHAEIVTARLDETGLSVRRAVDENRLLLLDANQVLDGITMDGVTSVNGFRAALGRFIEPAVRQRVYGELVSLLVQRGEVAAALEIERLGHELAHARNVAVLCGYDGGADLVLRPADIVSIEAAHDRSLSEGGTVAARQRRASAEIAAGVPPPS